jgi:hypothetical protein
MINYKINKIFQIGFNKCATCSLHTLFSEHTDPRLQSIHWDRNKLASEIIYNINNNISNILGTYEKYDFISDMEYADMNSIILVHKEYFVNLDRAYPNSKFILNVRPIDNWIQSRLKHRQEVEESYIKMYKNVFSKNTEEIIELWKRDWHDHIKNIKNYFFDRPNDLLIFDIENDNFNKLTNFFHSIKFTTNKLPIKNKTK